jgi:mRNA interferase RelE/StbE
VEVRFSATAARALLRSNKRALLREKIDQLSHEPETLAANITRLQGRSECRLRVQDWRIIFRTEDDVLWIDDIAPRSSVYEVKR